MSKTENQKKQGELMAKKFIRQTGAILDSNGNRLINEKDLIEWFKSGSYLNQATEWDSV
jgi:hypothetical protein